jgi:RNA polymerase sigma-70 factor (ECF subfamily)
MTAEYVDDLLKQLSSGESEALEALFEVYTPYLRSLVRRQLSVHLQAKFDSADVIQSVWVQLMNRLGTDGWHVNDKEHLRALLITITRRRLFNRSRRFSSGPERWEEGCDDEYASTPDPHRDSPSEAAQANDLWAKMLRLTPRDHHPVLILKRKGLPLAEIAAKTGLHEGSVRRIIRRLSRELTIHEEPIQASTDTTPEATIR